MGDSEGISPVGGAGTATAGEPRPFVLVTDIGRDIDDTVALIALSTYQSEGHVKLVGVVATGGAGEERARLTRFWLRRLGYRDEDVPVAACYAPGKPICLFPQANPGVPSFDDAKLYSKEGVSKERSAAELLLELADKHVGKLELLGIAPLSAVADALDTDANIERMRKGLAKVYIQGQTFLKGSEDGSEDIERLEPDFLAFNLSENKDASNKTFEILQHHVPFQLLSKHAAYRVSMYRQDFMSWDDAAGDHVMTDQARNGLTAFRKDMPAVFYRLYPVPEEMRGDNHWFKTITYVSHPFDPLLTVSACFPNFFLLEPVKNKTGKGDHQIIGRIADDGICGVPDPDKAREELNRVIRKAGERIRHVIAPEPVPFLLVTDIGRHVDDTLALLTVAQYQKEGLIRLAGVVTTGGEAKKRARLARFWLRRLGMRDSDVHVAACEGDVEDTDEPDVCELPETDPPIPEFHDAAIYQGTSKERSAAELILNLAELYNGKLHVFAMAPLTAVASALEFEVDVETMRKGLGKLWIQGQAYVNAGVLSPNFEAFNLRQDQKASVEVFEKLQNHVPFEMLSKHAAHRIEFTKEDFDKWDEAAGDHILLDQAISGLKGLRTNKPEDFNRLYPSCVGKGDGEWMDALTYISHPYQSPLAVAAFRADLFNREKTVCKKALNLHHFIIGKEPGADCGVPDPDTARNEICRAVQLAVTGASSAPALKPEPTPVAIVADFGRCDDIMALLTLASYASEGRVRLAGVVAITDEKGLRARMARYLVRQLGYKDVDVPVAAFRVRSKESFDFFPEEDKRLPPLDDATIYQGTCNEASAAELLGNLADLFKGRLQIVAMSRLTPIAEAIPADRGTEREPGRMQKGLSKIFIQGQADLNTGDGSLQPDLEAANLREDTEASKHVFESLRDHVPIELLGKRAAYRVPLMAGDLERCDQAVGNNMLSSLARKNLKDLRRFLPQVFNKVFKIPVDQQGDDKWESALTFLSNPYGSMLCVAAMNPILFERKEVKSKSGKVTHVTIGNTNEGNCGVQDPQAVRKEILERVGRAGMKVAESNNSVKEKQEILSRVRKQYQ